MVARRRTKKDTEAQLWVEYRDKATAANRNRLVELYMPYAHGIAHKISLRTPSSVELEDLKQAAIVGLIDAVERFDPCRNVAFMTFAYMRIYGAVTDELRRCDQLTRLMRRLNREWATATERLAQKLGRRPTQSEVSEDTGLLPIDVPIVRTEADCEYRRDKGGDKGGTSLAEAAVVSHATMHGRHDRFLDLTRKMDDITRIAMFLHYVSGFSQRETADLMALSPTYVSQLLKRARGQLGCVP